MTFTLVTDGSSDKALLPILVWLIREAGIRSDLQPQWADFGRLRQRPRTLIEKIRVALQLYPCELLFVHRDAEREARDHRLNEIEAAIDDAGERGIGVPHVCVVPVRMQEAWLLFSESAIRSAAANPRGRVLLPLPSMVEMESLPDPKERLCSLLRMASELNGRRLRRFDVFRACMLVAEHVTDYSPLRRLAAFAAVEAEVRAAVADNNLS